MSILVDRAIWRRRTSPTGPDDPERWAHLVSDEHHEELHAFAQRLGLRRAWFQGDHYDVPAPVRERAITLGAQPVSSRELLIRLRAAGLRRSRVRTGA